MKIVKVFSQALPCLMFVLFAVYLSGCTKSTTKPGETILESKILHYLPADTNGFLVWDSNRKSYQKFLQSPSVNSAFQISDQFQQIRDNLSPNGNNQDIVNLLNGMLSLNLIPQSANTTLKHQGLFSLINSSNKKFDISLMFLDEGNNSYQEKLEKLVLYLKSNGSSVHSEANFSEKTYSLSIPKDLSMPLSVDRLYLSASADKFVLSSKKVVNENFFKEENSNLATWRLNPEIQKDLQYFALNPDYFFFGNLQINKIWSTFLSWIPMAKAPWITQASHLKTETSPISTVLFGQTFSDVAKSKFIAKIADTKNGTLFKGALEKKSDLLSSLSLVPSDSGLVVQLNSSIFEGLKDTLQQNTKILEDLNSTTLVISSNSSGMPFPDVLSILNTKDVFNAQQAIVQAISTALGGPNATPKFRTKKIGDSDVSFLLTPFGIGIYLMNLTDALIASSSESAINTVLEVSSGKKTSLASKLRKETEDKLKNHPIGYLRLDMNTVASIIDNTQSSFAMFTGGQSFMSQEEISNLRGLGLIEAVVYFSDDYLIAGSTNY